MRISILRFCLAFIFLMCISIHLKAQQDTIFRNNGDKIVAIITEVGISTVSFKKAENGPTFIDNKKEIKYIVYSNGSKDVFPVVTAGSTSSNTNSSSTSSNNQTSSSSSSGGPVSSDHKIIYDGEDYYVNGRELTSKQLDRLLKRSNNPAVLIPYKTAKITKNIHKTIKILSVPTTIAGSIASISTFATVIREARAEGTGAQPSSWINAGLSFVGTLSFPITAKILNKRREKLYDKTIDIYNIGKL